MTVPKNKYENIFKNQGRITLKNAFHKASERHFLKTICNNFSVQNFIWNGIKYFIFRVFFFHVTKFLQRVDLTPFNKFVRKIFSKEFFRTIIKLLLFLKTK